MATTSVPIFGVAAISSAVSGATFLAATAGRAVTAEQTQLVRLLLVVVVVPFRVQQGRPAGGHGRDARRMRLAAERHNRRRRGAVRLLLVATAASAGG
jgi:hypothetical protein